MNGVFLILIIFLHYNKIKLLRFVLHRLNKETGKKNLKIMSF